MVADMENSCSDLADNAWYLKIELFHNSLTHRTNIFLVLN